MSQLSKIDAAESDDNSYRQRRVMEVLSVCTFLVACEGAVLIKSRRQVFDGAFHGNIRKSAKILPYITGAGALLEFMVLPLVGKLTDMYGRRQALLAAVYGLALSRLSVFLQPNSLQLVAFDHILTMSLVTSFFATLRTIQADVCSSAKELALSSGRLARWAGLGLLVGPYLEAVFTRAGGGEAPFSYLGAAALNFGAATILTFMFRETMPLSTASSTDWTRLSPFSFLELFTRADTIRLLMAVCLLQTLGDGRNLLRVTQSFLRNNLKWSNTRVNNYIAAYSATIVVSTFFVHNSLTTFGLNGHTSLANCCQILASALMALAPARAPLDTMFTNLSLLIAVGSHRKRDAVEALLMRGAQKHGLGMGETSAALANWRSVASIAGPLLFGSIYAWSTEQSRRRYIPGFPFFLAAALAIASEITFRAVESRDLVQEENDLSLDSRITETAASEDMQGIEMANTDTEDYVFLNKTRQKVFLKEKVVLSHDTRLFRFSLTRAHTKLGLPTGKHIKLWCPNPKGVEEGMWNGRPDIESGKREIERKYTPTSSDDDLGQVDVVIKVYNAESERFKDGGKMSQYMDRLSVGDPVDIAGPYGLIEYKGKGNFEIRRKTRHFEHVGMLAGGTGITPMLQLIKAVLKDPTDTTTLSLLYANQSEDDILVRNMLEEQMRKHPSRFRIWYTVDRPSPGWKYSTGFIDDEMIKQSMPPPSSDTLILMCGPPPMIKFACKANLDKLGYDSKNYTEF